jgi:hypothetical protein
MDITEFLNKFNYYILNPIIALLFAVATLYFIYGVIRFLSSNSGDKGTQRVEARSAIMWGLIGMFVMFSVYGIIKFVLDAFGITPDITARPYIKF